MDIEAFWEYSDAAGSEARLREALARAAGDDRLELQTQIARTYSLRGRFDSAHALLDEVERALPAAGARPTARYLLERGRTFRSAGDAARAGPLFLQAWDVALRASLAGLAVDAAHMLALVEDGERAAQWTARGIELARSSTDAKARALLPALLNNHAWSLYDDGEYAAAQTVFREAEAAWHATGRQPQGRIATWSVARNLRALGRHDEALGLQFQLEEQWREAGGSDPYVFEEIAENLEALGRTDEATHYFRLARDELLRSDPGFADSEPTRWQRLSTLGSR